MRNFRRPPLSFSRWLIARRVLVFIVAGSLFTIAPTASHAAIAYAQGTFGSYESAAVSLTVTYKAAQTAGNLNVIAIGWADSVNNVQSITDTSGNTYVPAGAPGRLSGTASQAIWYAKNIKAATAGTNTVTITFTTSVTYPDLRIAEYSGVDTVNPLDGNADGSSSSGTNEVTNSLTTTNANDLLVAADYIASGNMGAGPGYTIRLVDSQDQILEDKIVTALGSYTASATQSASGYWVIVMAAFKAANPNHTSVDMVVEEALSPFASWANVQTAYGATGNGITDDTVAIQNCLNAVNSASTASAVCYFPPGTYKISSTLQNTAGPTAVPASLIGADPATTKIQWAGGATCAATYGCAMLIQNGGVGADYERLTWDGASTAQYGVAEWFNTASKVAATNAAQHQDEVFQNMVIGIQPGRMDTDYGDNDSEGQVRRVNFINNTYAGLDTGSFNAVDWWVWDSSFTNCARGVSDNYGITNTGVSYGAGTAHVYRSNFSNSSVADVDVDHITEWLGLHNNFSTGAAKFIQALNDGENANVIIAENNRVVNLSSPTPILNENAGPLMLVDNQFGDTPGTPVYQFGTTATDQDAFTLGNLAYGQWPSPTSGTTQRIKSVNDSVVSKNTIATTAPVLPATPPIVSHVVYEVRPTDSTATIQGYIDSANASSDPQAIVHFGGRNTFNITNTLTIPAGSHVQLVGDGFMTILAWTATGNTTGPIISIAGPSKVTIRELQFHGPNNGAYSAVTPVAITGADSVGGRVQVVGSGFTGLTASNLANTQLSLQVNWGIAPFGISTGVPAVTLTNVNSAISVGNGGQGTLVMAGNSNYVMEDTWFEGTGSGTSVFNVPSGSFTYVGGNLGPAADGTSVQTVAPILVNGGSASQTYIGTLFNLANVDVGGNEIGAQVINEQSGTSAYFYGNLSGVPGQNNWFSRPGPDAGEVSFVSNRQSTAMPAGQGQYANQGDTSNAGILKGWAQARAVAWDSAPYTPPVGATDIRIYRVDGSVVGGLTISR